MQVLRIDAIPAKSVDTIKDWLTSVGLKYYESKLNLAWKPILKSIQEDPQGFIDNGGWEFLNMEVRARDGGGLNSSTMCISIVVVGGGGGGGAISSSISKP
jgi:nucleosome binding factor SPN SPT16 subunit